MRLTRRQKRDATAELECAMCVGNRQLLQAIQQDVAEIRNHPVRMLEALRIEVARMEPNDYLVLTSEHHLADEQVMAIQEHVKQTFPDVKGILLDGGLRVSVIHPDSGPRSPDSEVDQTT